VATWSLTHLEPVYHGQALCDRFRMTRLGSLAQSLAYGDGNHMVKKMLEQDTSDWPAMNTQDGGSENSLHKMVALSFSTCDILLRQ
jgi:hypothetical protein